MNETIWKENAFFLRWNLKSSTKIRIKIMRIREKEKEKMRWFKNSYCVIHVYTSNFYPKVRWNTWTKIQTTSTFIVKLFGVIYIIKKEYFRCFLRILLRYIVFPFTISYFYVMLKYSCRWRQDDGNLSKRLSFA